MPAKRPLKRMVTLSCDPQQGCHSRRLTEWGRKTTIEQMPTSRSSVVLIWGFLAFGPLGLAELFLAQGPDSPRRQEPSSYRYRSPGAAKSVEIGAFYLKKKNYRAALSRFREAIETDPYYAPAYPKLGKVYEKLGRKRESLRAYKTYLEVLPSARMAAEANDVHKAIARLEQVVKSPGSKGK